MATTKQLVLIGVLLSSSAAVWVPQFLGGSEEELPYEDDYSEYGDDEVDPDSGSSMSVSYGTGSGSGSGSSSGSGSDTAPSSSSHGSSPSTSQPIEVSEYPAPTDMETGGNGLRSRAMNLFESVSTSLNGMEQRRGSAPVTNTDFNAWYPDGSGISIDMESTAPGMSSQDAYAEFMNENPVTAVLLGESGGTALVGSKLVRPGTVLAGGRIEVVGITREGVRMRIDGRETFAALPPFRAAASQSSSDEDSEFEEEESAEFESAIEGVE